MSRRLAQLEEQIAKRKKVLEIDDEILRLGRERVELYSTNAQETKSTTGQFVPDDTLFTDLESLDAQGKLYTKPGRKSRRYQKLEAQYGELAPDGKRLSDDGIKLLLRFVDETEKTKSATAQLKQEAQERETFYAERDRQDNELTAQIDALKVKREELESELAAAEQAEIDDFIHGCLRDTLNDVNLLASVTAGTKTAQVKRKELEETLYSWRKAFGKPYFDCLEHLSEAIDSLNRFNESIPQKLKSHPGKIALNQATADELKQLSQQLFDTYIDISSRFPVDSKQPEYSSEMLASLMKVWGLAKSATRYPEHPFLFILARYSEKEGFNESEAWARIVEVDKLFSPPRPLECLGECPEDTWHTYWLRYVKRWKTNQEIN